MTLEAGTMLLLLDLVSLRTVYLTPRFHRVRLRRVTAALRPRYGRAAAFAGHSSQWVLFHRTRRVTAQKRPRSILVLGSAQNRMHVYFSTRREAFHSAGQEVDRSEHSVNPQNKLILQTLSLRSLSSRRRNASFLLRFTGTV